MLQKAAFDQSKKYSLKAFFWTVAILLGVFQAWTNRYKLASDDAIAYLDIGDAYLRGEWKEAINGYWSPLYSWLLGLTISVLNPSPYWEFFVMKIVTFLIYLFALVCLEFFLSELLLYYKKKISQCSPNRSFRIPKWAGLVSGYILFLWSSLYWIGIYCDTPDMCLAALVYLAAGLVLRIHRRSENRFNFIILGAVLGFGYLSKTAMFPIAFVFLAVGMFSVGNLRRALPRILAALLVFTIIVTPFIVTLSTAKGRLTFGDTGKLNYVWLISGGVTPYRFWQGEEPGSGTPKHPPRKIFDNPKVFEFATPVGGTYPPWHDPSYWYEGLKFKFNIKRQINILAKNVIYYYKIFLGSLIFGYLILVSVGDTFRLSVKELKENWRLLIPAAAGLGIYLLAMDMPAAFISTQPSTRYIAPFIVLLFAGVFSSVRLPDSQESKRLIAGMTIATLILIISQLFYQTPQELWPVVSGSRQHIHWEVADKLNQLGVQSREKIAIFGPYWFPSFYWARLARVKIIAEVTEPQKFWEADPAIKSALLKTIERTGAKVIVQKPGLKIPDSALTTGWQKVGDTGYYAFFFTSK